MSLHLDARQRAMLQEMGVTVWTLAPAETSAPPPAVSAPASAPPPPRSQSQPASTAMPAAPRPAPRRPAAPPPQAVDGAAAPALVVHAPQLLYPKADAAQTPAELGAGWLIMAESQTPAEPFAGDAGKLLDNMLRAMRLHLHPRVFLLALERALPGAAAPAGDDLAAAMATLQPAMVLLLGPVAARAALGRTEPLGKLRAEPHQLAGCPAIVSYAPDFLLRSQGAKASAWADLCRALAIVRARSA